MCMRDRMKNFGFAMMLALVLLAILGLGSVSADCVADCLGSNPDDIQQSYCASKCAVDARLG